MWFIIDTTTSGELRLYYWLTQSWNELVVPVTDSLSVLTGIHQLLEKERLSLSDIHGVGIVQKKGAFTATRVAATIANTLSFALRVPAIGVHDTPTEPPETYFARLSGLHYVTPEYSGEPSIGGTRTS